MKIKSLKIKNFRSYKDETIINFEDFTAFVGKNDIGKSTILEALDVFFNENNGMVKLDKTDISVYAANDGEDEIVISVCFAELPTSIVIDSAVSTTLKDEYMLSADGLLEIVKKYKKTGKCSVFIRAYHPTNPNCSDLLLKKNSELKAILRENGIICEDQKVNSLMRKAIWNYYSDNLELREIEIDASKEDAKKIWEKLSQYLPIYSLFQSDRKNSDGDSEVQDPLKEAVKQIIIAPDIQKALSYVAQTVMQKLYEVSNRTLEKLGEMDSSIAKSLNPTIPSADKLKWSEVFTKSVSITGDENIPINKRGSGVRRLILLNFFRAEAEQRLKQGDGTGIIYAIEEPETSQHSNNQRVLVKSLKELAKTGNAQIVITTHSSIVVKELDFKDIRVIRNNGNKKEIVTVEPAVLQYPSLNEVNYLAYAEVTEEYHNELYGLLEFQQWLEEYKSDKERRPYIYVKNGKEKPILLTLSEYVRHQIHHPENKRNTRYTPIQLKQSIEEMRNFIQNKLRG